ncbi:MAG: class I SAM-dependent methyltransferase [Chromatocurvus sp.]
MSREFSEISQQLETWYARDAGERLFAEIRARSRPLLDTAFGYHILQLGPLPGRSLLEDSRIHHKIIAGASGLKGVSLPCECDELPLESDSIDIVVALHTLEFCENPHNCLREMQRVLTPNGHLLIVGFNPYSLKGVSQRLRGAMGNSLWRSRRPVSQYRLTDWLHLVGCKVERFDHLYPLPPWGSERFHGAAAALDAAFNRHQLPIGSVYLAHAIKQVPNIRRPVQRLARRRPLIGLGVAKPAPTPSNMPNRHSSKNRAA